MTYNEFRLRFAIAYVGGVSDPGEAIRRMDNAPTLARMLWDVMNQQETLAPSFVSTTALAPIVANSPDLKAIARKALEFFSEDAEWIAIEANGEVWAYDIKPTVFEPVGYWDNSDAGGFAYEITRVAPPDNFRDELYEINKLLNNEND